MADKEKKPADDKKAAEKAPADKGAAPAKKGGIMGMLTKLPVLLGGVMVVEGVVLFAAFKMLAGGPAPTQGAELHTTEEKVDLDEHGNPKPGKNDKAELLVIEMRAPNKLSGRTFLYDLSIYVVVKGDHKDKVKADLEARKAMISDRIRTIVSRTNPEKLNGEQEPGLETFRRQVKFQLEEILGPDLIEEVLVPRCIPFRAEF
jgi:flagellar basal body-associated protein FliL